MADALYLDRPILEKLLFGTGRVRRFTQDTPVLPDVWIEYALDPAVPRTERITRVETDDPHPPIPLLLTPFRDSNSGGVRKELWRRIEAERKDPAPRFSGLKAPMPRIVYNQSTVAATLNFEDLVRSVLPITDWWRRLTKTFNAARLGEEEVRKELAKAVQDPEHPPVQGLVVRLPSDVLWMIRVVGAIAHTHRGDALPELFAEKNREKLTANWRLLVDAVVDLMAGVAPPSGDAWVYSVALNRVCSPAIFGSRLAVKADAARQLFNITCKDIRWAIIDSGIDASHPAFARNKDEKPQKGDTFASRVRETYDFSQIHLLLDPSTERQPDHIEADKATFKEDLATLNTALLNGRSIDWSMMAPLLRIRHDDSYSKRVPTHDHGTHVAGILGSNWLAKDSNGATDEDLIGICPDIEMYDLRILGPDGSGDEFMVMAALQFVRWLNSTNDFMVVHGVNMSLSIPHDVANYACGRTPICEESERLVASGVVVVVAAGNQGYRKYTTEGGIPTEAYNTISITDPGNADQVITVGATHRARPHTYGVSYFSSRGPTGDGRPKPDLVAPGEKITAPLPNGMAGLKDGTSMAAPHVSGAAALLMARHNELFGLPLRVKQILRDTATDLGRERYFQGAGMLDILRAIQSV